jgi:nitrate reductase alpha subunit
MIAKIENGVVTKWPLGEQFVRTAFPNTSFTFPLDDETLEQFGFARFEYQDPPQYDAEFQEAKEITPVLNGTVAIQAWEIIEKYTAEEKAEYITKRDADRLVAQKAGIRAERNAKLSSSDWTQVADAPVDKQAWATYRQALRDITTQTSFPWDVQWPTQPE